MPIGGTGQLVRQGTGPLIFTGAMTYSGSTTIPTGATLQFNNSALPSTQIVLDNGTLGLGGLSGTLTYSGSIAGTGGITTATTGLLQLSGINSYTGGTTISTGTLQLGNSSAVGTGAMSDGSVLDMNNYNATVTALSGAGKITNNATGAVTLTTSAASGGTSTFSGVIQDGGGGKTVALTQVGLGQLILSGANTYSGSTTIAPARWRSAAAARAQAWPARQSWTTPHWCSTTPTRSPIAARSAAPAS